jgi:hypothetical protein
MLSPFSGKETLTLKMEVGASKTLVYNLQETIRDKRVGGGYYTIISLEALKKTMRNLSQDS